MNRWTSMLALLLCACGSSGLPLPSIVSVDPLSLAANEQVVLKVELEGTLPFKVDYGKESTHVVTAARVGIGDQPFDILRVEKGGQRLVAEIPPGLPVGRQELWVEFTDGRRIVSESGVEVTQSLDITSFLIRPIATQIRLNPFTITLQALGPDAELFQGQVKIRINSGTVTPTLSDPFEQGVRLQEVTVDAPGGTFVALTIEDNAGHSVTSNDFRVNAN